MIRANHDHPTPPSAPHGRLGTAGVWDHDGAPLDPACLPLSPKLRARLARWCARFQQSFETEIDLEAFAAEGRAIARAVKAELPTVP